MTDLCYCEACEESKNITSRDFDQYGILAITLECEHIMKYRLHVETDIGEPESATGE
jgi:hypothetical protein